MPPVKNDPVRDQLLAARRKQILDGALTVFAKKGFFRATTREIAATAGISEGTIYNYYHSKQDLLFGLLELFATSTHFLSLFENPPDAPEEMIYAIFLDRIMFFCRQQSLLRTLFTEFLSTEELRQKWAECLMYPVLNQLEQYLQQKAICGQLYLTDFKIVSRLFVGIMFSYVMLAIICEDQVIAKTPPETLARLWTEILLHGLLPPDKQAQ